MRDQFTREEAERLLQEAAEQPKTVSFEEMKAAGAAAGIDAARIEEAAERLDEKRWIRTALQILSAAAALVVGAILLAPQWSSSRVLPIHNRSHVAASVDILVPMERIADCDASPDARFSADRYCVARSLTIGPYSRTRVGLPPNDDSCPQVWFRATTLAGMQSAVFALPVHVEIERNGLLDHKGLGAPNMFGGPVGDAPTVACRGTP